MKNLKKYIIIALGMVLISCEDVIDVDSVEVPTPEANIPEAAKAVEVEATALGDAAVPAGAETCALTTPDLSTAAPILSI